MDFFEHGGRNGGTNISYDFSANINPLGMPDAAAQVLQREWKRAESYPEETSRTLCEAIAGSGRPRRRSLYAPTALRS